MADLQAIRSYAASLKGDDRTAFIDKFNAIKDDDAKVETLSSRISSLSGGQQKQPDSISTQGLGFVAQHPFKTALQGLPQTITGKTAQDMAREVANIGSLGEVKPGDYLGAFGQFARTMQAGMAGSAVDLATAPINVVAPLALKAATPMIGKTVSNIGKFMDFDQRALSLGQRVRATASAAKKTAVDQFGGRLETLATKNPDKAVSLQDVVAGIQKDLPEMTPEAQSVFRKVPILKDMLKDPLAEGYIDPSNVSLRDTQNIINYINTKVPKQIKYTNLDVVDAQHNIRAAQLEAFPEMSKARAEYGKFAEDYKLIKSALNPKATPDAIMSNFNNNIAVKDAAKRVLSPLIKDMIKLRGQKATVDWTRRLGLGAIGAEIIYEVGKKVVGR